MTYHIYTIAAFLLLEASFITGSQLLPPVAGPVAFRQFVPPNVFPYASNFATGIIPAPSVYSAPLVPNVAPAVAPAVVPPPAVVPAGYAAPFLPPPFGLQARSVHAVAPAVVPAAYPPVAPAVQPVAFAR